jgi:hypothetical protein
MLLAKKMSDARTGLKYKPMSPEGRANISQAARMRDKSSVPRGASHWLRGQPPGQNPNARPIMVEGVEYASRKEAAASHGISPGMLSIRLQDDGTLRPLKPKGGPGKSRAPRNNQP